MTTFGRRDLLRISAYSTLAVGAAAALSSCGAAAAPEVAEVVFNPAVDAWLANLANSVAATEVAKVLDGGLSGVWQAWNNTAPDAVSQAWNGAQFAWWDNGWVHIVPPVVLVQTSAKDTSDPMTDRLVACVNNGNDAIIFEAWAWQALSMFVHELTANKTGDDLAGFQALCVISLIPSAKANTGASPEGSVAWMTYQTHNGTVEIAEFKEQDGSATASVTAYGIPDSHGNPMRKSYTLPTKAG